ncbi:hypothetical protein THASP1DRAFT_31876 [Thamnocephalis sphaerospora]|uniref:Uncharacterized protein n=1 Tax=Thamnocephalis sphaerospora TaxID=78915 RepID=A0A4P9XKH5_9FUNG|nr:hypothetical protein THASP1DRAFT_31876 [Thamnocephalis sphaerospora]|eukprot:RKP06307.1 hypothetical protein THASP1DRAFT_31876 [Thamnocephalis sphaerospora]
MGDFYSVNTRKVHENVQQNITFSAFDITFRKIWFNPAKNFTKGPLPQDEAPSIYLFEDSQEVHSILKEHGIIDLDKIGDNRQASSAWGTRTTIGFKRQYVMDAHGVLKSKFSIRIDRQPIDDKFAAVIRIVPMNEHIKGTLYQVETSVARADYGLLEFFGNIGGAFTLANLLFKYLFGQPRVRTWGVVQRYFMRQRILDRVHPQIAEVDKSWMSRADSTAKLEDMVGMPGAIIPFHPTSLATTAHAGHPKKAKRSLDDVARAPVRYTQESTLSTRDNMLYQLRSLLAAPNPDIVRLHETIQNLSTLSTEILPSGIHGNTDISTFAATDQSSSVLTATMTMMLARFDKIEAKQKEQDELWRRHKRLWQQHEEFKQRQEAFRLRMDMFYLDTDLFRERHSSEQRALPSLTDTLPR